MNLELAVGVSPELELGVRTGLRFTPTARRPAPIGTRVRSRPRRALSPTGFESVANPELSLRWAVAQGSIVKLGLEARAFLPIERNTHFGVMFGLPLGCESGPCASTPGSTSR